MFACLLVKYISNTFSVKLFYFSCICIHLGDTNQASCMEYWIREGGRKRRRSQFVLGICMLKCWQLEMNGLNRMSRGKQRNHVRNLFAKRERRTNRKTKMVIRLNGKRQMEQCFDCELKWDEFMTGCCEMERKRKLHFWMVITGICKEKQRILAAKINCRCKSSYSSVYVISSHPWDVDIKLERKWIQRKRKRGAKWNWLWSCLKVK